MDEITLNIILITVALAMPTWMAWRKANKRPCLGGWLLVVGLFALPFGLTLWLHPEWLNHPVTGSIKHLVVLPTLLSLFALGGGLVYLVAPLALTLLLVAGKAFREAFKDVEWRQDTSNRSYVGDESGYGWDYDPDEIKTRGSGWSDLLLPGDRDN